MFLLVIVPQMLRLSSDTDKPAVTTYLTLPDIGYNILQNHRKLKSFSGNIQGN
jgi:hypothetical protein